MDYVLHLLVFVLLYGMVALSLNVASGFTQLISLRSFTAPLFLLFIYVLGRQYPHRRGFSRWHVDSEFPDHVWAAKRVVSEL